MNIEAIGWLAVVAGGSATLVWSVRLFGRKRPLAVIPDWGRVHREPGTVALLRALAFIGILLGGRMLGSALENPWFGVAIAGLAFLPGLFAVSAVNREAERRQRAVAEESSARQHTSQSEPGRNAP